MSRSGLEIDRDTGNIVREGTGSCVVKVWHETNSFTGEGYYTEPESRESHAKVEPVETWECGCPKGEHSDDCPVFKAKFKPQEHK